MAACRLDDLQEVGRGLATGSGNPGGSARLGKSAAVAAGMMQPGDEDDRAIDNLIALTARSQYRSDALRCAPSARSSSLAGLLRWDRSPVGRNDAPSGQDWQDDAATVGSFGFKVTTSLWHLSRVSIPGDR